MQLRRLHTTHCRSPRWSSRCAILWPKAQSVLLPNFLWLATSRFAALVTSKPANHRLTSYDGGPAMTEVATLCHPQVLGSALDWVQLQSISSTSCLLPAGNLTQSSIIQKVQEL